MFTTQQYNCYIIIQVLISDKCKRMRPRREGLLWQMMDAGGGSGFCMHMQCCLVWDNHAYEVHTWCSRKEEKTRDGQRRFRRKKGKFMMIWPIERVLVLKIYDHDHESLLRNLLCISMQPAGRNDAGHVDDGVCLWNQWVYRPWVTCNLMIPRYQSWS